MVYKKRLCTTTIAVNVGKRDKLCEKADFIDVLFAEPPEPPQLVTTCIMQQASAKDYFFMFALFTRDDGLL